MVGANPLLLPPTSHEPWGGGGDFLFLFFSFVFLTHSHTPGCAITIHTQMSTDSEERILSEAVRPHTLLWLANALRQLPSSSISVSREHRVKK
jgi:hypothetical protein